MLGGVLRRWRVMSKTSPLLVLCRERLAWETCSSLTDIRRAQSLVRALENQGKSRKNMGIPWNSTGNTPFISLYELPSCL